MAAERVNAPRRGSDDEGLVPALKIFCYDIDCR